MSISVFISRLVLYYSVRPRNGQSICCASFAHSYHFGGTRGLSIRLWCDLRSRGHSPRRVAFTGCSRSRSRSSCHAVCGKDVKPTQRAMSPARFAVNNSPAWLFLLFLLLLLLLHTWKSNLVSCRKRKITTVCVCVCGRPLHVAVCV